MQKYLKGMAFVVTAAALLLIVVILVLFLSGEPVRPLTEEEFMDIRSRFGNADAEYVLEKYPEFAISSYTTFYSVHDLLEHTEAVVRGKYAGEGEVIGMGNGKIKIEGKFINNTAYYVETFYNIKDVYKGKESDALSANSKAYEQNTVITVLEYIGYGLQAGKERISEKDDGDYLLLIVSDNEKHLYLLSFNGINKIDENGNITWETKVIQEAAKIENITNLKGVKKAIK